MFLEIGFNVGFCGHDLMPRKVFRRCSEDLPHSKLGEWQWHLSLTLDSFIHIMGI